MLLLLRSTNSYVSSPRRWRSGGGSRWCCCSYLRAVLPSSLPLMLEMDPRFINIDNSLLKREKKRELLIVGRRVRLSLSPRCLSSSQPPPPLPPPPGSNDSGGGYAAGVQEQISNLQDRVRIFLAVLFWMSLFFWGSAWDGRDDDNNNNNNNNKKGGSPLFRKKF